MQAEHKTKANASELPGPVRRMARRSSVNTALIFLAAMSGAIIAQWLGFALVGCALLSYFVLELRPFHIASKPQT